MTILGKDTIYNDLKVWLFTGAPDGFENDERGELPLRGEFEEKYFSDLPKNLEKPHIGPLSSKWHFIGDESWLQIAVHSFPWQVLHFCYWKLANKVKSKEPLFWFSHIKFGILNQRKL